MLRKFVHILNIKNLELFVKKCQETSRLNIKIFTKRVERVESSRTASNQISAIETSPEHTKF